MKFAVGYQLSEEGEESFLDLIKDFKEYIDEVYFPWLDIPTCRMSLTNRRGFVDWKGQERLEEDLKMFRRMGIKLDLLLNGNCYGKYSVSQYLSNLVCSIIEHIQEIAGGLDIVTTASPAIAHTVKKNFKDADVRASVNMRIGTIKGMEYLSGLFDSFYLQREYNRDFSRIKEIKEWCNLQNKDLYMLANSGCMNFCSGQIFHDNLVAHEKEIGEMTNITGYNPVLCQNHYRDKDNWVSFLQGSWIRPEDIKNYKEYFPVVKLATRMHSNPRKVIQAYVEEKFSGNLLDLMEPGYGPLFLPYIMDNSRFPDDWFKKTTGCDKRCYRCNYGKSVLKKVLLKVV